MEWRFKKKAKAGISVCGLEDIGKPEGLKKSSPTLKQGVKAK